MPRSNITPENVVRGFPVNLNGRTQISNQFPMGPGYYEMHLRLNIVLTVGTAATPLAEGELNFLRQIRLQTDAGEVLVDNLPARALFKAAIAKTGCVPRKDAIAAASATYRIDIPIFFVDYKALRPEDTVLDTSRYNSITLDLVTGPLTDLFTSPGTGSVVLTADIDIVRSKGRWDSLNAPPVGYIQYSGRPPVDAASATSIDLERATDLTTKRMYVHTSTSGVAGQPWYGANSDAIIDVANLKDSDTNYIRDQTWAMVQDRNKIKFALESVVAGMTVYDFIEDGSLKSGLYTGDKNMLQFLWSNQAGVGANSIVSLMTESYRAFKAAA